ncbi:MAG TPA: nucleotidyl transferase AbiEii/AbiGii toxin family protein [Polyangia bacterium]|nr:nucleotidyl transferase AbiEii/AbiGii toxin family protein [Polyangia bacterium]
MIDLYAELAAVVDGLSGTGVDYALCGALALAVHGVPRATKDLDLLARKADAPKVRVAVRRIGYLFEALPMEFSSGVEVQRFSKLVDGRPLMLDFLWAEGALEPLWARRQKLSWREGDIWVVSREDLITLKLTAGRPQDLVDIQSLAKLEGRRDKP